MVSSCLPSSVPRPVTPSRSAKRLPGTADILGAFVTGDRARTTASQTEAERVRTLVEAAEKVHPGARARLVAGHGKCWDEDRYARGAFALLKPGQLTELGPALASADGCVHFTGDHTPHRPGWMHGAVASAKRVVREVRAARGV